MTAFRKVVFLSGGVGGARLLAGFAKVLPSSSLTAIVNTGDDLVHWGLYVCPDLDTVMYTLSGRADDARGWGLSGETFHTLAAMQRLGAASWFSLGDNDLATHLTRTLALSRGVSLTRATEELCRAFSVAPSVLPMSDAPRPTVVETFDHGVLGFQEWLVRERAPRVKAVRFMGEAQASDPVLAALEQADLVVIGPSNPFVSIDPILCLAGVRERMADKKVVAVSPLVHGRAVKGPLAEMMPTLLACEPRAAAIARYYGGLLSGFVVERGDEAEIVGLPSLGTETVMKSQDDRARLAEDVLRFAAELP